MYRLTNPVDFSQISLSLSLSDLHYLSPEIKLDWQLGMTDKNKLQYADSYPSLCLFMLSSILRLKNYDYFHSRVYTASQQVNPKIKSKANF